MRLRCARWVRLARKLVVAVSMASVAVPAPLWAEVLTLKNGTRLEGNLGKIGSIGNPLASIDAGEVQLKRILVVDDNLRRVFVGTHQVAAGPAPSPATSMEKIKLPQRVPTAGNGVVGVGPIVRVTPFDEWGRRIFTMSTPKGSVDVIQGITEITPTYAKVEALQSGTPYVWSMRIATSSIPRETLSKILLHRIDPKNPDERLKIVRLYLQAERIQDARAELEGLIKDFPELGNLQDQVKSLHQLAAQRLLKEVELRRDAGQHRLAYSMLSSFPSDGVAGETLLKVRDRIGEYDAARAKAERVLKLLAEHQAALTDESTRSAVKPICDEIAADLNIHTLDRMADYLRLADDPSSPAEQKLSLAISGWLLGSGSGIDNLAVSRSLYDVRNLVREYLRSDRKPARDAILAQLTSLEGSTPANIAKLLAHMKPAIETPLYAPQEETEPEEPAPPVAEAEAPPAAPEPKAGFAVGAAPAKRAAQEAAAKIGQEKGGVPVRPVGKIENRQPLNQILDLGAEQLNEKPAVDKDDEKNDAAKPKAAADGAGGRKPAAQQAQSVLTDIPGLLRITTPGLPEDPEIEYHVQLPPEYDPYRRYPVVITLNGAGTTPLQQIDWWAGAYSTEAKTRFGQGTRHGYIVVAPKWLLEHQRKYEYTAREHAAVLYTLRDVCKRFSVDTDKVFLSGHSIGGDAAWDIGLAHPDLWAGVMPIVATADKYVNRYWENAAMVPFYFVSGEKDGNKLQVNASEWDRYLTKLGWDVTVVQYQGRGHEHFHDEIQRLFDWMNLHKRNFFPREFKVVSMRPWDNFFWWIEVGALPSQSMVMPIEYPPGRGVFPAQIEGNITATNGVRVQAAGSRVTAYLSPEMIDFSGRVTVTINGKKITNVQPDVTVLLEDARTRGDRLHPFWAKAEL